MADSRNPWRWKSSDSASFHRTRTEWVLGALAGAALALLIPLTCSGPESESVAAARETVAPADSALAARLLAGARGADPVVCGLAARALDQGWWGNGPRVEVGVSDEPGARQVIEWALSHREDHGGVATLAAALAETDPCARRLAARVLGRTNAPQAVAALRRSLASANPSEREMAAVGLGYAEDSGTIPALVEALEDPDVDVRIAAAWALGEIEDPAAIEPLTERLAADDAAPVREAAAWALGKIE
ncbi:MAG: HEAT repeat domain-containing protein [Gemmatimonadota bacterium]